MFHGWMFDPDGDQAAADSTRSSTSLDTGASVNPRTDRRLVTASYTSIIHRLLAASHRHAGHEALWPRRLTAKVLRSWRTLDARLRKKDDENLRLTLPPG